MTAPSLLNPWVVVSAIMIIVMFDSMIHPQHVGDKLLELYIAEHVQPNRGQENHLADLSKRWPGTAIVL